MRRLDWYLIREMAGPFLFGMGAFAIVLIGVDLLYDALKLIMREGLPASSVLQAMAYRLPQTLVLTLPMAVIFSVLMAFSGMSGHGEVVAMRAGGIGLPRLARPVLLAAVVISLLSLYLNGWLVPYANAASEQVLANLKQQALNQQENLVLWIPSRGSPQRVLYASRFDPESQTLYNLVIWEFRRDRPYDSIAAASARWEGETWILTKARLGQETATGRITEKIDTMRYDLGKSPWELARDTKRPREMTMAELKGLLNLKQPADGEMTRLAREEMHLRLAVPWAALGLALIGLPLGIRPQRTSTSVGLGLSLAIILAYYIILSLMRILGQQGSLPPIVADWIPNVLLYTIGLGLLVNASR